MKMEITNAQLNAIVDLATDIEAKKKSRLIKKCLINDGYENPFNTIK